jgi:hypothetical protein
MRSTGIDGRVSPQPIYAYLITTGPPPPRNPGRAIFEFSHDTILSMMVADAAFI